MKGVCLWGWGRVSDGVLMCRSSYVSMSMSMGRSWYCPFTDFVVRPSCCSMSFVVARSCSGDRVVVMRTHMLRNLLADSKPHGSVSMADDTRSTVHACLPRRRMALCMVAWRSPRLEPSERYAMWLLDSCIFAFFDIKKRGSGD